jgi:hypothetical protein
MIEKIYKLKQQQINQQLLLKQQVVAKVDDINKELSKTSHDLNSASVNVMGAISDFRVLQIHKDTMKEHMIQLGRKKLHYLQQVEHYNSIIVDLNKESEQFNYILQEQKKEKLKQIIKQEEMTSAEYVQIKHIQNKKARDVS